MRTPILYPGYSPADDEDDDHGDDALLYTQRPDPRSIVLVLVGMFVRGRRWAVRDLRASVERASYP